MPPMPWMALRSAWSKVYLPVTGESPGDLVVPRAEGAGGVDVAGGNGVGERRVIGRGAGGTDIVQDDVFEDEDFRILLRVGGTDDELRIIEDDLADAEFDFAAAPF